MPLTLELQQVVIYKEEIKKINHQLDEFFEVRNLAYRREIKVKLFRKGKKIDYDRKEFLEKKDFAKPFRKSKI